MAGDNSRRDLVIKKAIREVSIKRKITRKKVTNYQILDYMIENNLGKQWVTSLRIKIIRPTLPEFYREEF